MYKKGKEQINAMQNDRKESKLDSKHMVCNITYHIWDMPRK